MLLLKCAADTLSATSQAEMNKYKKVILSLIELYKRDGQAEIHALTPQTAEGTSNTFLFLI